MTGNQKLLTVEVDGDEVTVTGTTKGDPVERAALCRPWVWSRYAGAWVLPRSLRPETRRARIRQLVEELRAGGRQVEVHDTGARLTVQEERERAADRLECRADRHESAAERAVVEATASYQERRRIGASIPPGQPILVGHHSERRHRRDLERMDAAEGRWIAAEKEHERRAQLAAQIRRHLEHGPSPVTVKLRLRRNEAELRKVRRNLARPTVGAAYKRDLTETAKRLTEAIELDQGIVAALIADGRTRAWSARDFRPGDGVYMDGGRLGEVVKVNRSTLKVRAGGLEHSAEYVKVTGRLRDGVRDTAGTLNDNSDR